MKFESKLLKPQLIGTQFVQFCLGFFFLFTFASCAHEEQPKQPGAAGGPVITDTTPAAYTSPKDSTGLKLRQSNGDSPYYTGVRCEAFYDSTTQWGYDIYTGSKLLIHQTTIPSLPGNHGFKSKAAAYKAGSFVTWKLISNIFPPSISKSELDSLQVLN